MNQTVPLPASGEAATPAHADIGDSRPTAFTAQDGLTLRGRYYPAAVKTTRRPVVCLAGLTRNGRDFNRLCLALSSGARARDVYTLDMRGRGASDWDKTWRNYAVLVELADVIDFMTVHGLFDAAIIGTSRGGLIAMGMMAVQPTRVGALVLNDIGPVIDSAGLARISAYVGATPQPHDWPAAADLMKRANQKEFPRLKDDDWMTLAHQWFNEDDQGRPAPGYDPAIARTFAQAKGGIPPLWPQFQATTRVPCLTIRGANSDLLSHDTVAQMARQHPRFSEMTVADQGHAPLLRDQPTIDAIATFLADTDPRTTMRAH